MPGWVVPVSGVHRPPRRHRGDDAVRAQDDHWEQMVLWVPVAYLPFAIVLVTHEGRTLPGRDRRLLGRSDRVLCGRALVLFFYALTKGEASTVVPVTSVYPLVTLVGAAIFLGEQITTARVIGALLIVSGIIVISR